MIMKLLLCAVAAQALRGPQVRRTRTSLKATRTEQILQHLESEGDGLGAGAAGTLAGLRALDARWEAMRRPTAAPPATPFVTEASVEAEPDFDVVVLGGTLGIFAASAFQARGLKVCVIERGPLAGRNQEWNLSLDEVRDLVDAGALHEDDIDGAVKTPGKYEVLAGADDTLVASHFGSVRAGFNDREHGASGSGGALQEVWLPSVLNVGVRPDVAVRRARRRFEEQGGVVREHTACNGVVVGEKSAQVTLDEEVITTRLVVDAMGNASPVARQCRREANDGADPRPSGICCVVGTSMAGFAKDNSYGDLIYTNEDTRINQERQYFWEAFPAMSLGEDARTTYLFTYLDADEMRQHTVEGQFEDYWRMLPTYQKHNVECLNSKSIEDALEDGDLVLKRCLYGLFPTYKDSPLPTRWDRVLAVGDASGVQSPLSFGGFGALTRHLGRVTDAVEDALQNDALDRASLALINGYAPNIAATWMFQKSFVHPVASQRPASFVNRLMRQNYINMEDLGDDVLRPFNQDVVQPRALLKVLGLATLRDPLNILPLCYWIGPQELVEWLGHFGMMLLYDGAHHVLGDRVRAYSHRLPDQKQGFALRRLADAWEYGSGMDY
jgi:2-polyprenyl-6-methoxyphenol hydroxylase-like FAD-dependent oxidoreductase